MRRLARGHGYGLHWDFFEDRFVSIRYDLDELLEEYLLGGKEPATGVIAILESLILRFSISRAQMVGAGARRFTRRVLHASDHLSLRFDLVIPTENPASEPILVRGGCDHVDCKQNARN